MLIKIEREKKTPKHIGEGSEARKSSFPKAELRSAATSAGPRGQGPRPPPSKARGAFRVPDPVLAGGR